MMDVVTVIDVDLQMVYENMAAEPDKLYYIVMYIPIIYFIHSYRYTPRAASASCI
jgi:hypothetical protein